VWAAGWRRVKTEGIITRIGRIRTIKKDTRTGNWTIIEDTKRIRRIRTKKKRNREIRVVIEGRARKNKELAVAWRWIEKEKRRGLNLSFRCVVFVRLDLFF